MTTRQRRLLFIVLCAVAVAISLVYMWRGARLEQSHSASEPPIAIVPLDQVAASRPGILFRSTRADRTFGKVAFLPLDALDGPWHVSALTCDRVYFRGGRGVCLTVEETVLPPYAASVFDDHFRPGVKAPLSGVPSRTRVSDDGRRAAFTVFESGHSYADGGFSTRTTVLDTTSGTTVDLETFAVSREGELFSARDFNFWGVTFAADGNRFYATLRTANTNYLIEGDLDRRVAHVLRDGVECPSLSPDQRRLAFKKRTDGPDTQWQVALLDLETMQETVLDAGRSVDDQVEWLDDTHIVYFASGPDGNNVWSLRTDRGEAPRLLIRGGYSPAVIR